MNRLATIVAERRRDAETARRNVPLHDLIAQADILCTTSLARCLADGRRRHVIAEVKKASPSAGLLRPDYRPAETAEAYAHAGAAAISVLTEPRHFQGSADDLIAVREAVELPVLRKDFIADEYQVAEAAAWGADVVLLIVAALTDAELRRLHAMAVSLRLETLVEAHDEAELDRALALDGALVGVNSRNLKTLKTDLDVARRLAAHIPAGRLAIAESGIRTRAEIDELRGLGYKGFLVGETLLRQPDPGAALLDLIGE